MTRLVYSTNERVEGELPLISLGDIPSLPHERIDPEIQEILEEQQKMVNIHASPENLCYGIHKDNPNISDTQSHLSREYNGAEREDAYFSIVEGAYLNRRNFD